MGEIDDMRAIIEASIVADSRHGEKMRALDALYHLRARAEAAEQRAEAAEAALAQARADQAEASGFLAECHKQLDELEGILSDTLAARARAEAEAERLRAELAQARADALVLAGLLHFDAAPGLAEISVDALTNAIGAAASLPDTEVLAVIRRALGGAA